MYDRRIDYAINNFINNEFFLDKSNKYILKEKSKQGESILIVNVENDNICVEEYDNDNVRGKCNFLKQDRHQGLKKCIDHFLLSKNGENWALHMIEMKTSVGNGTWHDIKHKNRASYFNIMSLCLVLGIKVDKIYSYTTYETEKFQPINQTSDIKAHVPMLGKKLIDFKKDEWDKGKITIELDDMNLEMIFPHRAIKMIRNSKGELEGELTI